MKTKITNLISCFLLLSLMVACGKEKSSSSNSGYQNPLINPNIGQTGTAAYNSFKAWYDGATESNTIGAYGDFLKDTTQVSGGFSLSGSFSLCIGGLINVGNCSAIQPNGCYVRNPDGTYRVGTPTIQNGITTGCNPTVMQYTKSGNADLVKAISGNGLVLHSASQSGTVYTLFYAPQNSFQPTVKYTIDTSLHSLLNPVLIQETTQEKRLKGFRILQY